MPWGIFLRPEGVSKNPSGIFRKHRNESGLVLAMIELALVLEAAGHTPESQSGGGRGSSPGSECSCKQQGPRTFS